MTKRQLLQQRFAEAIDGASLEAQRFAPAAGTNAASSRRHEMPGFRWLQSRAINAWHGRRALIHLRLVGSLGATLGLLLFGAGVAFAFWAFTDSSNAHTAAAMADSLPQGSTPNTPATTPNPHSSTVVVTFAQVSTTTGKVAIAASDYALKRYPYPSGSAVTVTVSCSGTGTVTCTESGVPDGTWQYTDTPTYGNNWLGTESGKSGIVTVDTTAPGISITYPVGGTTYGTNWAGAVTGTTSDATDLVSSVQAAVENTTTGLWWNGASFSNPIQAYEPATGTSAWSMSLPATSLATGDSYSAIARATDAAGNVGTSSSVSFTYSTAAPSVAVTYPVNSTTYGTNWTGTITGTSAANAPGASIAGVKVSVQQGSGASSCWTGTDGTYTATCPNYVAVSSGTTNWSLSLSASELTSGTTYHVLAQATDSGGNVGTSSTITFTYSTVPPSVAVTYPVNSTTYGTNWTGTITGTSAANAPGASIAGVKVSVQQGSGASSCWTGTDGTYTATCPNYAAVSSGTTSWSLSLSAAELTSGDAYHLLAQASDSAGNVGTSSSTITFTYSTAAPSVAVTYPVNSTTYGTNWTGTITGTSAANAPGASIAGVKVSVQQSSGASSCWTGTDGTYTATCPNYVAVSSGTTSWSLSLSASELTSGTTYHVLAQATDSGGNVGTSSTITFTYSTVPPSVAVTYPVNSTTYGTNWTGTITGTSAANAPGASIAGVKVSVQQGSGASSCWTGTDGTYTATCPNYVAVSSGTTSWSLSLSAAELTSGDAYHLLAQATDSVGNVGTSSTITFTYLGTGGFVQTMGGTCNNCASLTLTPSSPITAGDLIVVSAFEQDGKNPIITVSDSANDTYTVSTANPQDNKWGVFAYTSGAASVAHITITVSGTSPTIAASFAEFAGYTATLDTSSSPNSGTNTTTTPSASISTSNAKDLLIGTVGWDMTGTLAQAPGFAATDTQSIVGTNSPVSESLSFEAVTATGSYTYNPTLSVSSHWTEFLFAFKHS